MPANTSPIFGLTPNIGFTNFGAAANAKSDGSGTIGTDIFKAFTAGSNGSYVDRIRLSPVATAVTATTATTIRIFFSTATSGATTSANTALIQEFGAASQSADNSTNASFFFEIPIHMKLPASTTILIAAHVINAANTNWVAVVCGEDF